MTLQERLDAAEAEKKEIERELKDIEVKVEMLQDLKLHPGFQLLQASMKEDLNAVRHDSGKADTEFKYVRACMQRDSMERMIEFVDVLLARFQVVSESLQGTWK